MLRRLVKSPCGRFLMLSTLSLVGMFIQSCIALAGVKFSIEYDWVANGVAHSNKLFRQHFKSEYWIDRHNNFRYFDTTHVEHLVPLGHEGTNVNSSGDQGKVQVHVVGGRINFYVVYAGRAMVIVFSSNGSNSCSVSITYYKLHGHEYSELRPRSGINLAPEEVRLFSGEHAENVSCVASETSD